MYDGFHSIEIIYEMKLNEIIMNYNYISNNCISSSIYLFILFLLFYVRYLCILTLFSSPSSKAKALKISLSSKPTFGVCEYQFFLHSLSK